MVKKFVCDCIEDLLSGIFVWLLGFCCFESLPVNPKSPFVLVSMRNLAVL